MQIKTDFRYFRSTVAGFTPWVQKLCSPTPTICECCERQPTYMQRQASTREIPLHDQVDQFIMPTLSIRQNMKSSLDGRHITSWLAGGRHPKIDSAQMCSLIPECLEKRCSFSSKGFGFITEPII
ncbi:hypothetical protein TNCV_1270751 [Trichonephila clavipes]|nr:hypothetical protein TNCV_1270751 [Trichonephila clavipes]